MIGIIEHILRERYGEPIVQASLDLDLTEYRWKDNVETNRCILFKHMKTPKKTTRNHVILQALYGDFLGGFLVGNSLKLSMLEGPKVFGLYQIDTLHARPEVRYANSLDPDISFFMDAANVWYYGLKQGQLFVYDAEFQELYCKGEARFQLDNLISQWEKAGERTERKGDKSNY